MKKQNPNQISLLEPETNQDKPKAKYTAQIYFDGGCVRGNPGDAYGSYELRIDGHVVSSKNRVQFGRGTSNTAEFDSLLIALDALNEYYASNFLSTALVRVLIQTDSTIVRNWINRFHSFKPEKCTNERRLVMADYAGRCVDRLSHFHSYQIEWKGREDNVQRFGH